MLFHACLFLSIYSSAFSVKLRKYDEPILGCGEPIASLNNKNTSELTCAYICQRDPECVSMLYDMGRCTGCVKPCKELQGGDATAHICWDKGNASITESPPARDDQRDCVDLRLAGIIEGDGVYQVKSKSGDEINVYCTVAGQTVFLHRSVGDVSFNRTMQEYVDGFGDADGDHWLGLEHIHEMTYGTNSELRIRSCCRDYQSGVEVWTDFEVGPGDNYTLHVGHIDYASFEVQEADPSHYLNHSDGAPFTTKDVDRDMNPHHSCSENLGYGGWWYKGEICTGTSLTGKYTKDHQNVGNQIYNHIFNKYWSLTEITLMLRRKM